MIRIYYDDDKDERLLDVAKLIKKFLVKNKFYDYVELYLYEHEGGLWYYVVNKGSFMRFLKEIENPLDIKIKEICSAEVGGDYWNVFKINKDFGSDISCLGFGYIFKEFKKPEAII